MLVKEDIEDDRRNKLIFEMMNLSSNLISLISVISLSHFSALLILCLKSIAKTATMPFKNFIWSSW